MPGLANHLREIDRQESRTAAEIHDASGTRDPRKATQRYRDGAPRGGLEFESRELGRAVSEKIRLDARCPFAHGADLTGGDRRRACMFLRIYPGRRQTP